jgi:small subunit ribosomal protein S21
MIKINVNKEKGLESALKKYKFRVQKSKQTEQLRNREEFVKPSVARRDEILKATYKQKIKSKEDRSH